MNQILVTKKLYVTPELKRKKHIYKFNFIFSIFLIIALLSGYIYAEYDRNKSEEISQDILTQMSEVAENTDNTKDAGDVFFNLSHSGTKVALGISDKEIGVDIERERNFKESLIKRVFSEEERKLAEKMGKEKLMKENAENDDSEKTALNEAYTALWTAKESIMKYTGKGIALLPEKIELSEAEGGRLHVSIEGIECTDLRLTLYSTEGYEHSTEGYRHSLEGYTLCVCSEYEEFEFIDEF